MIHKVSNISGTSGANILCYVNVIDIIARANRMPIHTQGLPVPASSAAEPAFALPSTPEEWLRLALRPMSASSGRDATRVQGAGDSGSLYISVRWIGG
jgi:hypothetical protein